MLLFVRVAALLCCAAAAFSLDLKSLRPQGYVSDFARVIPAPQRQALEAYLAAVERQTGAQVAIVTLPSVDGEPIEDVANTLYRQWGVGKKETNEGAMLLLSINDRRSRLEVGYGLEPILPDGAAGDMLRAMRPSLREGAYGDALLTAGHLLGSRIAEAKGVTIAVEQPRPSRRRAAEPAIPGWLIVAALLGMLFLFGGGGGGGGMAWLLGSLLMQGGGRSRGGGGFGGYDSGGGFGGFGGGDSGGGGASSDW